MRNELSFATRRGSAALALALLAAAAVPALPAAAAPGPRVLVTSVAGDVAAAAAAVRSAGGRVLDALPIVGGVSAQLPVGTVLAPSYRVVADSPLTVAEAPAAAHGPSTTARGTLGRGAPAGEGKGVTVAVVDTGVAETPDLAGRVEHVDVTGEGTGDGFGHGTFVAGLIAGNGAASNGKYAGIAPAARVLDVRVADDEGKTSLVTVLKGLQAVARHPEVSVLNLSLSSGSELPYQIDPLTVALGTLWRRGVTVVVPAGNSGSASGTITSPGSDPLLLTVGALDDKGTAARGDDDVPTWSSRGPAPQGVAKPDLVAPGRSVVSLRAVGSRIDGTNPGSRIAGSYFRASGTSFSTAVASGAVAALLAERPSLRPTQVKSVLKATAYDAPRFDDPNAAGAGGLDLAAAYTARAENARDERVDLPPGSPQHWFSLVQALAGGDPEAAASSWSQLPPAAKAWVASSWSSLTPEAQAWLAINWARASSWSGQNWAGQNWAAINWAAMNWAAMNWAASSWSAQNWAASSWSGQNWAGQNWAGQNWAAQNWAGMNWAGISWSAINWSALNWSAQNWSAQNWSAQNWSAQNWSAQNWSAQNWH